LAAELKRGIKKRHFQNDYFGGVKTENIK
jgi:hypothetical protein